MPGQPPQLLVIYSRSLLSPTLEAHADPFSEGPARQLMKKRASELSLDFQSTNDSLSIGTPEGSKT